MAPFISRWVPGSRRSVEASEKEIGKSLDPSPHPLVHVTAQERASVNHEGKANNPGRTLSM